MKTLLIQSIRWLTSIFKIFPLQTNTVLFSSFIATKYACNPKYISEYLENTYPGQYKIVWCFKKPDEFKRIVPDYVKIIRYKSLKYWYYYYTAKIIVDNSTGSKLINYRKDQFLINTWHGGGAYKRVGLGKKDESASDIERTMQVYKRINLFLSSSKIFTKLTLRESFLFEGEVMECGMPRNDCLLKQDHREIEELKNKLGLQNKKIVLYAPTFRSDLEADSYGLDFTKSKYHLEKRFSGDFIILIRTHYYINKDLDVKNDNIMDVSNYPEMQDLLLISDVLITDYSSSIWDFSLMYRPCFLFATDIEKYNKMERPFYTPIETWPFPLAKNNEELAKNIDCFDEEKYVNDVKKHHNDYGNCESGEATKLVVERMIKEINSRRSV